MVSNHYAYMIRLDPEDFTDPIASARLARAARLSESEFVSRFGHLVSDRSRALH